ncbi:uncharacterized protein ttc6 isoform X2 [Alosa sapidissima]|uniref:uncharacterized protein ttc6 isoform X2 n=1 Tax=Alosa sapidissima TaxID=34773 RepID=UPI001C087D2F|nr:uncharacterized protein ttc6 isoform X2 [Alosa sapidissima]
MPSKKVILKPYDELRMKREVEVLLKKSKMEYQQIKAKRLQEKSRPTSLTLPSDCCHWQGSDQLPVTSEGADHASPKPLEPQSLMSPGFMEFRADLLPSPPSSVLLPDKQMSVSPSQESPPQSTGEERASKNPLVNAPDSPVVFKPAIAQLAGTTKAVSMSQRPQPPPKPRSERPPTEAKVRKTHIRSVQALAPGTRVAKAYTSQHLFQRDSLTLSSDNLSESNSSDDSGSGQSARAHREVKRRKRRRARPARSPESDKTPLGQKTKGPIIPHSVKSATELLEEARNIAGREVESQEEAAAKTLVRTCRRTVDEIIVSLQSGTVAFSASGNMIKELMKQVLGDDYFADNEEESSTYEANDVGKSDRPTPPAEPLGSHVKYSPSSPPVVCGPIQRSPTRTFTSSHIVPMGVFKMDGIPEQPDLKLTEDVSMDGLEAKGETFPLMRRPPRVPLFPSNIQGLAHLATWAPKTDTEEYKTIHHLCTTPASQVLPVELQLVSRVCHTSSQLNAIPQTLQQRAALKHSSEQLDAHRIVSQGIPLEALLDTEQEDCVSHLDPENSLALSDWKRIAEYYVERPRILMHGHATPMCEREMKMFWSPAPPKFGCAPIFLKDKLFPKYQAARSGLYGDEFLCELEDLAEAPSGSLHAVEQHGTSVENVLCQKSNSMVELRADESTQPEGSTTAQRPRSAPLLSTGTEDPAGLRIRADFSPITAELEGMRQHRQPQATRETQQQQQQQLQQQQQARDPPPAQAQAQAQQAEASQRSDKKAEETLGSAPHLVQAQNHHLGARGRVLLDARRGKASKAGRKLRPAKLAEVLSELKEKPRTLLRSESVGHLPQRGLCRGQSGSLLRWPSLPTQLDFQSFASERGGIAPEVAAREWVRDIWDAWFDELFPPLAESDKHGAAIGGDQTESPEEETRELEKEDLSLKLADRDAVADLQAKVEALSQAMAQQTAASAFDMCRRGALYKKLGLLNQALEDLDQAISLEPGLLNAYWHRHSIYLLRNDHSSALQDLNFIIKHNKKHADAFQSRAEIFSATGQHFLAIINYTHAIRCRPGDDEMYFRRAQMYMQTDEIVLAMEDYVKTHIMNPKRTDALMIHGQHYFRNSNLLVALTDFTSVLRQEPGNAKARTCRGQIYAKLGQFYNAVEDFSLAVHLNPNDWLAFYHRGCLLRKRQPETALRDLSTSVLINDGQENFSALLHRGLVYCDLKLWKQALADFEAVVKLDSSRAIAHVNLGLIYMLKMDQHHEAIQMFTNALKVNPTYYRAYICRAKAFHIVGNLKRALKDLTCATHIKPDAQQLYILRAQYLCDMGLFSLATRCIQYAAEMNQALGTSPLQQAAVQSFLGNNDKAIACLTHAVGESRLPVIILQGKTQMKASLFPEAVESFKKALLILEGQQVMSSEAAQIYHLMGMCYMAQDLLHQACDAFSNAVKINPDYAEAYHQRGLCRMRLNQSKSVQDLNRALSLNPNFFQVYLSRATFYGSRGRYSKAILNCNEAIKVQPNSVRAYLYRGAFKYFLKVYQGAVEDLTTVIKLANTCSFAYYNRAVCYHQMKEYELALRDYSIVLLLPEQREISLKVLINRGLLYVELNDHHNALADFIKASERKPKDSAIHHALGVYHHRLGQLKEAVEAYTEAMRLSPFSLDAYVGRGSVYMDYGHAQANKQAQRDFLSALHLNPLCLNARICLGYNFQVFGCFQKAWNQFTIALEISPSSWAAYEGRAVVSLQMGNLYAAFQDISKALRHNPLHDQLLTNRGVISQYLGDKSTAMKDYQKAICVNPSYSLAYFNAANLYFFNRQFEQALEYYSKAIELDPGDESAVLNRAITLTLLRKVPEALQDFTLALQLNPHSSHVYLNRANLYCSLRRYRSAERDLTQAIELQPSDALLYKLRADVRGHLGLTQEALQDYGTALELQEAEESGARPR